MRINCLSGNMLKIFAAVCMVIDHAGMLFFPKIELFRIIGRLSFPIFAYMIAQGCRYTKNKTRYFAVMFFPAAICQSVYALIDPESLYYCILVTFSMSVVMIYALQYFKTALFCEEREWGKIAAGICLFTASVFMVWIINRYVQIDYGFWGCMTAVFASVFQPVGREDSSVLNKIDYNALHTVMLGMGLVILWRLGDGANIQKYALFALVPLLLYSGERGKWNMKNFFYIFYPMHLAILGLIYILAGGY